MSPPRAGQGNAPRDSLELASLASSESAERSSRSSSPSGISSSRKLSLEDQDPLRDSHEDDPESGYARAGQRSYSVSSAFDFGRALFPLSSTAAGGGYAPLGGAATLDRQGGLAEGSLERHKTLTYLNGLSLVVGLIIGSGIFSSPSQVNSNAGSYGASLIAWVVAGVLAWTGAASYAELGGAIPLNGGSQAYLSKIFGELAGFLFAWCAVLVLKPGSAAIIAIVFGEYVVRAVVGADAEHVNPWIEKGVAVGGLALVILVNCVSTKATTRAGDILMIFKFIALVGITVTGIVVAVTGLSSSGSASQEWKTGWFHNTNTDISGWAVALYGGLWAFDGWDNTSYVTGEFKRTRDIPRVIHTAMPLVIISYILANVSYFLVLPQSTIESTNAIAVQFGAKVFGSVGSLVLALVVSMSCIGALNATIFTSGRLVYIAGKEGYLPSVFGKLGACGPTEPTPISEEGNRFKNRVCRLFSSDTSRTPINAMALNGAFVLVYIIVGEFKTLVTFYGVAGYTFYFLTVLGLIVLRIREPYLERPYKTWISTPIIFCCVSLFLLSRAVISEPLQTLIVVAFVLAGVPVYGWSVYRRDGRLNFGSFSRVFSEGKWKFWK